MNDAAKLRKAIEDGRTLLRPDPESLWAVLIDAAEKHLATLPKTKPMWLVIWYSSSGWKIAAYLSEQEAAYDAQTSVSRYGYGHIATVGPYEVPDDLP